MVDRDGLTVTKDKRKQFTKALDALTRKQVLVGIPAEKAERHSGERVTNVVIGYISEFGSPAHNIPPRPSLVPGVKSVFGQLRTIFKATAKTVLKSAKVEDAEKGLNTAGLVAVSAVRARIVAGEGFAPLKPATLAARRRRGFAGEKPLVVTGQFVASFTHVIRPSKHKAKNLAAFEFPVKQAK